MLEFRSGILLQQVAIPICVLLANGNVLPWCHLMHSLPTNRLHYRVVSCEA
jgi:hypothetical protein